MPQTLAEREQLMAQPARDTVVTYPSPASEEGEAEARRSFLRMVSHELRTPLNAIIGFSEILSHELCGPLGAPQYREYAELIGASGHRLLKLVNQILEIVRLEGGSAEFDLHREPLAPIIQDAFNQVRDEAEEADVRLLLSARELPDAVVDARAMAGVLVNLLRNAITHSPPGAAIVVDGVRVERRVVLTVRDQGPGVPAEDIDRIMRPFEQGEHALTRATQGAGLGLPIARLLCQAMGGSLHLEPSQDGGLTVRVQAPAA
jgi:signal transduction histidine kinase